jgi:predicted XRE-type DNA-binding protein
MDGRLQTVVTTNKRRYYIMKNSKIKIAMIEGDLKQYEVARLMGIHEGSLSRLLRDELPAEEQDRIVDLIRQHTKTGGGDD